MEEKLKHADRKGSLNQPLLDPVEEAARDEFSIKVEIKEMLNLALPLLVSFGSRYAMATTDNGFVGHISHGSNTPKEYLSAAALATMVTSIFCVPPLAFNVVLNSLCGQAMGAKKPEMAGIWLQLSLISVALAYLPCLIGFYYVDSVLLLLGFDSKIASLAGTFARYSTIWPIPNAWYQCLRYFYQAQGITRPAMWNNLAFVGVNFFLNWLMVMGGPFQYAAFKGTHFEFHGLGFVGSPISLTISRCLQPLAYYLYMMVWRKEHIRSGTWPKQGWRSGFHQAARVKEFLRQALPNVGTLIFQAVVGQATTLMIGKMGEVDISSASVVSTVTQVWSGGVGASVVGVAQVRVGYHLGAARPAAAQRTAQLVLHGCTLAGAFGAALFMPLRHYLTDLAISGSDGDTSAVQALACKLIFAVVLSSYFQFLVSTVTGGVFSAQGRNQVATALSFGFELPFSIGAAAVLIFVLKTSLEWVYWGAAVVAAVEACIVLLLLCGSDWSRYSREARERQEQAQDAASNSEEVLAASDDV